jgi:competence protein ComEC
LKIGDRVVVDEETRIYALAPFPRFVESSFSNNYDLNNSSLVLLVKHRDHSILFTGDAEAEVETYLQLWREVLKSDVLKVAHHGSKTSTTENFLAFIHPKIATISVAERNRFGHPSQIVLERLSGSGSRILRTDRQKAIWLRLKKEQWKQVDWE